MPIGPTEAIVFALIVFLLFGAKKLPEAAKSVGKSIREFKGEMDEMKTETSERKPQELPQAEKREDTA